MNNDDFFFLRKFKDIQIFSEEEKQSILLAKNSEIISNVLKKQSVVSDFFINNIFSYSLVNNVMHSIYSSNHFSEKSIDEYLIASSPGPIWEPRDSFFIYNESVDSYEDGKPHYMAIGSAVSANTAVIQNIKFDGQKNHLKQSMIQSLNPEIKSNVSYKDAVFAFMIGYKQKEDVVSTIDKIFAETLIAISSYDEIKASNLLSFLKKEFSIGFMDASTYLAIGKDFRDGNNLFLKIKEMFSMLSSKMIYFDISGDCEESPSLYNFSKTCFDIIKNYCGFINGEKIASDAHARLFVKLLAKRGTYNFNLDFRATQDPFISVMVELAHIYAEKNNLDLISKELIEKVFAGNIPIVNQGSFYFKYAVVYSTSIRNNSELILSLSPKNLKKTLVEQRKILYVAAINSGNLNKNLVSRLAVERCDVFHEIGASLIVSRFLYLKSKVFKEISVFKWSEANYIMCMAYLYLLRKKDFASLFTINLDINNFKYSEYFNICKSYLLKKISAFEK